MEWYIRFARHRSSMAATWAEKGASPGHVAYAREQATMWDRIARHAHQEFDDHLVHLGATSAAID